MGVKIYSSPFLLLLLLALLVEGKGTTPKVVQPTNFLSLFTPKRELTTTELASIRGAMFSYGAIFLQIAGTIYAARWKYKYLSNKYGEQNNDEEHEEDYMNDYMNDYMDDYMDDLEEGDYKGSYEEGYRRPYTPDPPPPPPPLRPLTSMNIAPYRLPPHQRRYSSPHKRSFQTPPAGNLQESVRKLLETEDVQQLIMTLAQLIQELVDTDVDGCLLKLLCHLQEKSQHVRTDEEDLLASLVSLKDSEGPPTCGQEVSKCPVEEAQLVEAFSYMWQLQNAV